MEFVKRNKYLLLAGVGVAYMYGMPKKTEPKQVETYPFTGTQEEFRSLIHNFAERVKVGQNLYIAQHGNLDGFNTYAAGGLKLLRQMKETYFARYSEEYGE